MWYKMKTHLQRMLEPNMNANCIGDDTSIYLYVSIFENLTKTSMDNI